MQTKIYPEATNNSPKIDRDLSSITITLVQFIATVQNTYKNLPPNVQDTNNSFTQENTKFSC